MCSSPNVYMFVYILIGTHMVTLKYDLIVVKIHSSNVSDVTYDAREEPDKEQLH